MPAVWNEDDLTEGGLASIEEFIGRLVNVEEDVEGKYNDQTELHFEDVEIIEAGDDVVLDEGKYTAWINQSNKKNSTNGKMLAEWTEFCKAHDMGPMPSCFFGVLIRWRKSTYEFGDDMNPGRAMIPVEIIEEGGKKKTKTTAKTKPSTKATKPEPPPEDEPDEEGSSVPDVLTTAIFEAIGEDGATREMIRRHLAKKAALRKALTDAGGLDEVLGAMDNLDEDNGTYTRVPEDDIPF